MPTRSSASPATPTRHRSRRPSAGSRASCTRTSTRTTPTRRRSSRRPPRPTRSSPTPSAAQVYDRYGHEGLRNGGSRAELRRASARSRDLFDAFFGGGGRHAARRPTRAATSRRARRRAWPTPRAARRSTSAYEAVDRCERCHGNGAEPGTPIVTCERCGGSGVLRGGQPHAVRPGHAHRGLRRLRRRRPAPDAAVRALRTAAAARSPSARCASTCRPASPTASASA